MDNLDENFMNERKQKKYSFNDSNDKLVDHLEAEEHFYTKYIKDVFYSSVFENKQNKPKEEENKENKKNYLIIRELKEPNTE